MSSLPGQLIRLEADDIKSCRTCGTNATHDLVIEADAFGSETVPYCSEHGKVEQEDFNAGNKSGDCDWCKASGVAVSYRRDFEEGSHGKVYEVCRPCIDKQLKELNDESDSY